MVKDGYSSWIASRCNQTATKTTSVKKKYSSSSNDSYSQWIDERLERLKKADATNKSLISSLLDGIFNLDISTDIPKTNTTTVKDGYNSWIADRQLIYDMAKTSENMDETEFKKELSSKLENGKISQRQYNEVLKEVNKGKEQDNTASGEEEIMSEDVILDEVNAALDLALNGNMSHSAFEKYLSNMLEKGKITSEQYYETSLKLQLNKYENLTGIELNKGALNENTEQAYYDIVDKVKTAKVKNIDEFFELYSMLGYGVDQAIFKYCPTEYYNYMLETIKEKYHMTYRDAKLFMQAIDSIGACTYATACNSIVDYFYDKPSEFEEIFGFPLLKVDSNGCVYLNQGELLADMFYIMNHTQNGGKLFEQFGDRTIFTDEALNKNMNGIITQEYMFTRRDVNQNDIAQYLKYKGITSHEETIFKDERYKLLMGRSDEDITLIRQEIDERRANGEKLNLGIKHSSSYPVVYELLNGERQEKQKMLNEGAHAVYITGTTDEGVEVATWGGKYLIRYEELYLWQLTSIIFEQEYNEREYSEIEYNGEYIDSKEFNMDMDRMVYTTKKADGEYSRVYQYYFGTKITETSYPDGTFIEEFEKSDTGITKKTTYSDGTEIYEWSDGNKTTIDSDGTQIYESVNGDKETVSTDGTRVTEYASGDKTTIYSDGTQIYEWANGNKETVSTDGTRVIEWASGDKTTIYSDGTQI